ncbi:hypothetical protein L9F63_004388, partial [Diploptera punctata]
EEIRICEGVKKYELNWRLKRLLCMRPSYVLEIIYGMPQCSRICFSLSHCCLRDISFSATKR